MKIKIYSARNQTLSKDSTISLYVLEKNPDFFKWLNQALSALQMNSGQIRPWQVKNPVEDKKGNLIRYDFYTKQIQKMVDVHEKYENGKTNERVDLFYGKNRIQLTLICSYEKRMKFANFLKKQAIWEEKNSLINKRKYLIKDKQDSI